jgi:hypothetical protein
VRPVSVVLGHVFGEYTFEMSTPEDQYPLEHSRRMVPTKRSPKALARGALTVWVPRISSASRHQVIFMDESAKTIRPT